MFLFSCLRSLLPMPSANTGLGALEDCYCLDRPVYWRCWDGAVAVEEPRVMSVSTLPILTPGSGVFPKFSLP